MSKEKRFVAQVDPLGIEDVAIFDNKELRLYECQIDMIDICNLLNQQEQRIAELEEQLKNAIAPKFKVGQEVWYIDRYGVQKDIIVSFTYFSIENEILYKMHDEIIDHREKYIFATKEEAQAKLEELGEKK